MNKIPFRTFLKNQIEKRLPIFIDGGMGTMIQKTGLTYKIPEDLNFYKSQAIKDIHKRYFLAGANVATVNSFGANPLRLEEASHSAEEYIAKAIEVAKEAALEAEKEGGKGPFYVAWDSGQIGKLLEPMGTLTFDQAYESYKSAAMAAEKAGADLAIIETMSDLYEVKAAILAIKENTDLPVLTSMTFQPNLRTLTGADVLTCVTYLEALRPDIIGFNCGGSLEEDAKLAKDFLSYAHLPVSIEPNAGLPTVVNGKDVYLVEPEEFALAQLENYKNGCLVLGGCCGTTPDHISAMVKKVLELKPEEKNLEMEKVRSGFANKTYLCSYNKCQEAGGSFGPIIIGERINPTGKKKFKEALLKGDIQYIVSQAESQIGQGAHVLDVNVGLPGIDEGEMMVVAVKAIQEAFNVPLQLDSSEAGVLEKTLRYYNGKALVNSTNGKAEVMEAVLPLVKKYGGCLVALCIDEDGIAPTAQGRVAVAKKIIKRAGEYGIPVRDIFIDTLTLTVSSEQKTALETVKAIRMLKDEYGEQGLQFVLGVSNISFGLPRRDIINSRFFMLALEAGLTGCIANPASQAMMDTYRAYRALACYDENSLDYIQTYTGSVDPTSAKAREDILTKALQDGTISISLNIEGSPSAEKKSPVFMNVPGVKSDALVETFKDNSIEAEMAPLVSIIERGFKDKAADETERLLKKYKPVEIINSCIVPALDSVGRDFESGKKFLPQLLLSADTVSASFAKIKASLESSGAKEENKGTIAIATVYGDIHDIGKNIVKAMLENYGYKVIDMGKNVAIETVAKTVSDNNISLLGLSALMTTTVTNMEETIKEVRKTSPKCKIMVGGAVLTADYAEKIGADFYAKDAMESVRIAKRVFGS